MDRKFNSIEMESNAKNVVTRESVLAAVMKNGFELKRASPELRADREIVLASVAQNGWALKFASNKLQADREIVLASAK